MSEKFVRGVFGRYAGLLALLGGLTLVDGLFVPHDMALFAEMVSVVALVMVLPSLKSVVVWHRHYQAAAMGQKRSR